MTSLAFDLDALPWKPGKELPSDRLVLARIEHFDGRMLPHLVMAKSGEDGVYLHGGKLSYDWHVAGWLEPDFEIELLAPAVADTAIKALEWEKLGETDEIASDGLGGHYVIEHKHTRVRLRHQVDDERLIPVSHGVDPHDAARLHHAARIRRRLEQNED